jgi:hypothetical protein
VVRLIPSFKQDQYVVATTVSMSASQSIENKSGERGRNRTFNLLIKSQLLCQLSYAPEPFAFIDSCEVDRAGLGGTFTKLSQQPVQLEPPHCIAHFIYAENVTSGRTPPASCGRC